MWPIVPDALRAALLCALLYAASAQPDNKVYGKLGGEVSLTPPPVTDPITSLLWLAGQNIAVEWEKGENVTYYQFKGRGHLNTETGVLTIRGLMGNESGAYFPDINSVRLAPTQLEVISGVPVPTVTKSCREDMTTCDLTCEGDTADAGPVTYAWKYDGEVEPNLSGKVLFIKPKKDGEEPDVKEFSCEMANPVSRESSRPLANPFAAPEGVKISTGLAVFLCLLLAVLLLVVVHRLKAGEWFFEKGSMPWEAEFWQKPSEEAKGAAATQQQGTEEEGMPMT